MSDFEGGRLSVVDNAIYVDGRRAVVPHSLDTTFEELRACPPGGHSFGWIGLIRPSEQEVRAVAEEFGLHPLAVEDTITAHQRPTLERYGDLLFAVLRPARYVDPVEVVEIGEVHLFVGPDFVITVRHADGLRAERTGEQDPQHEEEPPRVQPLSASGRSARSEHGSSLTRRSSGRSPHLRS